MNGFPLVDSVFEIIVFKRVTFELTGDGGYQRWAFQGGERQNAQRQPDAVGKIVVFTP